MGFKSGIGKITIIENIKEIINNIKAHYKMSFLLFYQNKKIRILNYQINFIINYDYLKLLKYKICKKTSIYIN